MCNKTLSVCLITKNEELNIERCISSIKNIADEIVVVDTGSTDKTVCLAKNLGASVYFHKWNNDFSEAKNFALDKCTKDWIFVIDADEALEDNHDIELKKLIQNTCQEAFYLNLINWIGKEAINKNQSLRIFRNRKEYRFVSRLHEQIFNSIENSRGSTVFSTTNLILNHYGYDHNIIDMDKKFQRNISVLNSYSENEKDGLFYFGLGSEYLKVSKISEAKECFIKSINFPEVNQSFRAYASVSLAKSCFDLKEYTTALDYVNKFLKEFPDFRDLYFLKAVYNHEIGKYSQSYIALNIFNALPLNNQKYPSFNFEQTNDIENLLEGISALKISHENNLLTTVININSNNNNFENIIKNANEISNNVVVINSSDIISKTIFELGAITLSCDTYTTENLPTLLKSKYKSQYILFIDSNSTFSYNSARELVYLINNKNFEEIKKLNYHIV